MKEINKVRVGQKIRWVCSSLTNSKLNYGDVCTISKLFDMSGACWVYIDKGEKGVVHSIDNFMLYEDVKFQVGDVVKGTTKFVLRPESVFYHVDKVLSSGDFTSKINGIEIAFNADYFELIYRKSLQDLSEQAFEKGDLVMRVDENAVGTFMLKGDTGWVTDADKNYVKVKKEDQDCWYMREYFLIITKAKDLKAEHKREPKPSSDRVDAMMFALNSFAEWNARKPLPIEIAITKVVDLKDRWWLKEEDALASFIQDIIVAEVRNMNPMKPFEVKLVKATNLVKKLVPTLTQARALSHVGYKEEKKIQLDLIIEVKP